MVSVKGLEIILFKLSLFQYADRIAKSFYLKMIWDYPTQKRVAGELQKGCQSHDLRALQVIQRSRVPKETNPGEPGTGPKKECLTRKATQKRIKLDLKKSIGRPIYLGMGPIYGTLRVNWVMKVQKPPKFTPT